MFTQAESRSRCEKDLVLRLDIFVILFGCTRRIISSALSAPIEEDLHSYVNEFDYFTNYIQAAYCFAMIPGQIIMAHVGPNYWLSGLEIASGVITGFMAVTTSAHQICVLKVLIGLCEYGAWFGMVTLLMHWYTPEELAMRLAIYHLCQAFDGVVSETVQAALINALDGLHGISGWRWLFSA
ncbi:hypothetical protein PFICI_12262 [Pestalotiopsis fici W106-1]|uniref:Major facilitator superfamily (MFS) profile domain-containing protein n=1 Tax=Pestalotiopsis fici (strain W106-1 / CGMCC3.15140) TaxID=1229662 RepID=W3WN84_PESFW|nr:uncharacterized protein PFICI_12262 [Pestalotiopsis fici W106-1]ETS75318.1 hypothetical protein PFICI_12262 [Pestalotiopsis fici W106-1]